MLKKQEVLHHLEQGATITISEIYNTAIVYDAAGKRIDTCRHDTACNIGKLEGYSYRMKGDAWSYTSEVSKPEAVERVREAAAEELEEIKTPGTIKLRAKTNCYIGNYHVIDGRTYNITVYGDGSHSVPGNAYGSIYDFRADIHAVMFEIIERPEPEQPGEEVEEVAAPAEENPREKVAAPERKTYLVTLYDRYSYEPRELKVRALNEKHATLKAHAAAGMFEYIGHIEEAPTGQAKTDRENREHCKRISDDLDDYAEGRVYRCPDCDAILTLPNDVGDKYHCPHCHTTNPVDDLEQLSLWDYFDDFFDIKYLIDSDCKTVHSVKVCVAWGGPSIYIDTETGNVELYWWTDRAYYHMKHDTMTAIDEWAQEFFNCR